MEISLRMKGKDFKTRNKKKGCEDKKRRTMKPTGN